MDDPGEKLGFRSGRLSKENKQEDLLLLFHWLFKETKVSLLPTLKMSVLT